MQQVELGDHVETEIFESESQTLLTSLMNQRLIDLEEKAIKNKSTHPKLLSRSFYKSKKAARKAAKKARKKNRRKS